MRKSIIKVALLLLASLLGYHQVEGQVFWQDDFENASTPDLPVGSARTPTNNGGSGGPPLTSYFVRTPGTNTVFQSVAFTGMSSTNYWAGEDHDTPFGASGAMQQIEWTNINIAGKTGLTFKGLFAANNANGSWDNFGTGSGASGYGIFTPPTASNDYILVEYAIDAGAYTKLISFFGDDIVGPIGSAKRLLEDTDNNFIGDGTVLTSAFAEFTKTIAGTGSIMKIRISVYSNGGNEEWGIDNFRLEAAPSCTQPTITCPGAQSLSLNASCQASLPDYSSLATVTGPCSPTVTQSPVAGTVQFSVGAVTVSLFATNTALQSNTCTFTVNKVDVTNPTISCPLNVSVNASVGTCAATVVYTAPVGTDNCTGATTTRTAGLASGASYPVGVTTNVFRVTDAVGNTATCSFTVTVADNQLPTITCPSNIALNTTLGTCSATATYTAPIGSDNCPSPITIQTAGLASGVSYPKGLTTNVFRVTDASANTATCSFTVTVSDNEAPALTCPAAQTLTLNSSCTATLPDYTGLATASDNCPPAPVLTQSPAIGSVQSGVGALTVSIFAADAVPNSNTCTFTVNKVSPEIDVLGNSVSITNNDVTPSLTDHTDFGSVVVSSNIVRTYTISNTGTGNLQLNASAITVSGGNAADFVIGGITLPITIGPSLTTTFTVTFTPSATGLRTTTLSIANNDCDENPYNYAIQGTGLAASPDINVKGNNVSIVDGDLTPTTTDHTDFGSVAACTGTLTRTFTIENITGANLTIGAISFSGAAASDFSVTTAPAASVTAGNSTTFVVTFDPSANGLRSATLSIANNDPDENPYDFAIQGTGLADITNPTIACPATQTQTLNASCQTTLNSYTSLATASDNCGSPTVSQSPVAGTVLSGVGTSTITLTASDASGNTASCTFNVSKTDVTLPTITCPANQNVNTSPGVCAATATYTAPVGTDNCSGATTVQTAGLASGASFPSGINTNTFRVTDGSGNTATCSFTITVTDNQVPTLITLTCNTSNASGTAYNDGWQAGDNDGAGFGAWALVASGTSAQSGFFVGNSTGNGAGTDSNSDGDVNTGGRALGFYANSSQATQATRPITGTFAVGSKISIDLDNGFVDPGQLVGFQLQNASGQSLGEVRFRGGQATYEMIDVAGITPFGSIPFTDEGITIEVTSVSAGVASMKLTRKVNNATQTLPLTMFNQAGGQVIAKFMVFNSNAGSGASNDVYINNMVACLATPGCPANVSTPATLGACSATATYTAPTAYDNCSSAPTVAQTAGLASGATFPVGVTTNTFRATDGTGNTSTCSFTVTVTDNQAPSITCPANVSVNATVGACTGTATYTAPVGTDNCAGSTTTQTAGLASGATYPVGTTTNTFRVTDGAGNTSTCSFTVTVTDNQVPSITCPANVSVNSTVGACTGTATYTAPVGTDNCSGSTTTQTAGLASGATYPVGTTTNTFRVTDGAGNTATCSFTVTVTDNQAPSITCPANVSVNATVGACTGTATYTAPTGTDNCSGSTTTQTAGLASGATYPVGVTSNTFRVTDAAGNTATCSFTVTVVDNQTPSITCPANVSTNTIVGTCAATVTYSAPTGTDNCSGSTTTQTAGLASGASFSVGVTTNTFRVTDGAGNTATCSFTVTVTDNQAPSITCPANVSVNATVGACSGTATYTAPVGTDNCSGSTTTQTAGLASGATYPVGVTTNTFRVTDGAGNTSTCSFTVTVVDNQAPSITCPANVSLNAALGTCAGTATYTAPVGTDNCSGATTALFSGGASGSSFAVGVNTVQYRVTDAAGNTSSCTFTVTVIDNQAPTITCPANVSVSATVGSCAATATYTAPIGTDNCSGATTALFSGGASGSSFTVGVNTVQYRVTDASGNTASCTFTVTVTDNESPTITCPANVSVNATVGSCAGTATYTAPVGADNCAGATTALFSGGASGSSFNVGVNTVQYRVTDASGNTASCTFTVMVNDVEAPSISCPANQSVNAALGQCAANASYTAPVGTDNCAGATTSLVSGGASGSAFNVGVNTVVYQVTDASGNTSTCSFTITVLDTQAPTITCPANMSVSASVGTCAATVSYTAPVGSDNCPSPTTTLFSGGASGSSFNVGVNSVQYRVTDASGNTASCTFTITVNDIQPPSITCPANIVGNTDPGLCTKAVTFTAPVGTDNCSGASTSQTAGLSSGSAFPKGVTNNTFTVTDASGNSTNCTFTVTINDAQLPSITCPAPQTVGMTPGQCSGTATYTAPVGSDNCPGQTTTQIGGLTSGATFPSGVTNNIFRVTDASGNTATCAFTITVNDNVLPTITCPANVSANSTPGQCAAVVSYAAPVGSDNCPGSSTSLIGGSSSGASFPVGTTTNTYRVVDAVGNTATCSFTVTVVDNQAPSITCPANINAPTDPGVCNAVVTYAAPVGTDNCSGASTTQIAGLASGATFPIGTTTNTFRVTAANGASTTCSFTVNVADGQAPTAVCQALTVNLSSSGSASINATQVNNGSTDNCGVASTAINTTTFGCANVGNNNVILTVTDVNGNTGTCSSNVLVRDVTAPLAVCQNLTVNLNNAGTGSITANQVNNGSTDACGIGSVSVNNSTFSCANVGVNTVTLTVSDVNGNTTTCSSNVLVRDLVAPVAVCQNLTVDLNASGNASITPAQINNGSSDACGIANLNLTATTFSCANVGNVPVTLIVTDVNSNTGTCSAVVTVRDVTPPTAACQGVILNLNAAGTGTINASQVNNGSADACGINTTTLSNTSFNCANVGNNNVTLTVSDVNGNTASCTAVIQVRDLVAPTALCHGVTVNLNASGAGAIVPSQVNNGSSDACGISNLALNTTTFSCANVGSNPVTLTVTDVNGNTASCSAVVTVSDLVAPIALCHGVTAYLNASGNATVDANAVNNGSTDACGIGNLSLNTTAFTCANIGSNTVILTVTDVNNNTATCSGLVQIVDTLKPVVVCQSVNAYLNALGSVSITTQAVTTSSSDNCGVPSLSLSATTFSCADVGNNNVVLTATDASGNTASCGLVVSVNDTIQPIIVLPPPPPPTFADSSLCGANVTWAGASASDNCFVQSLTSNYSPGDLFPIGTTTVTYTAIDNHGNSSTGSFVVTVNPRPLTLVASSPVISCGYNLACALDSNATANAYVAGGCTPYAYVWSTGDTTATIANLVPGTYWVTITDGQQGMMMDSVTITAPAPLILSIVGDTVVCDGSADGNLQAVVTGGNDCLPYNYQWSTGSQNSAISGLTAGGPYSVTVTDVMGCSLTDSSTLALGVLPVLELGPDTMKCPGTSLLFEAPPIFAAYEWSNGTHNSTILFTQTGTYICQVWTAEGCSDNDTILVDEYVVDYDIITPIGSLNICDGDTVVLVGDGGLTNYDWSTGDTTSSTQVAGQGGVISLSALDSHGCYTADSLTVNYTPFTDPQPVIVPGPNAVLCDGGTLQLDVQSGYFAYDWSTGGTTQSIVINAPGVYSVTVANGFGCTRASTPVTVVLGQLPTPTVIVGTSSLSTGNYAGYQWLLNGNQILGGIAQDYTPVVAGNYSVSVTDSNGCSGTSSAVFFNPVGIAEQMEELAGLQIYPNPTNGTVNLRTLNPIDWPVEVEVWDMFGQRVKHFHMAHLMDVTAFDLSDLAAAPYMMKVTSLLRNRTLQSTLRIVVE